MTLKELVRMWLNEHRDFVKPTTILRYEIVNEHYIKNTPLADKEITEISRLEVQAFMSDVRHMNSEETKKPLSTTSINLVLTVLTLAFRYAVDMEVLESNPCDKVKRSQKKETDKVKCFTIEEQTALERYIDGTGDPMLFGLIICLYTGLRIGELCALEWDDIDFETGMMSINKTAYDYPVYPGKWEVRIQSPKTKKSLRVIPLPDHLVASLAELKQHSRGKYVISKRYGEIEDPKIYRMKYNRAVKNAGIRKLNFHCLRHTFATRALENGMDVKTLADVLGHANPTVTLTVYAHSTEEHKKKMMNTMKRLA